MSKIEGINYFDLYIDGDLIPTPYYVHRYVNESFLSKGVKTLIEISFPINKKSIDIYKKSKSRNLSKHRFTLKTVYVEDLTSTEIIELNLRMEMLSLDENASTIKINLISK